MERLVFLALVILLIGVAAPAAAAIEDVQLYLPKTVYSTNERIELSGYLLNHTSSGSQGIVNATINLSVFNTTAVLSSATTNTSAGGIFYSNSSYSTTSPTVTAPSTAGSYNISANYSANVSSIMPVVVIQNTTIDELLVMLDKAVYLAAETVSVTFKARQIVAGTSIPVINVSVNGTLRNATDAIIQSFTCTTDTSGVCNTTLTAPSTAGSYYIETNNYFGYATFRVVPFDVVVSVKDSTGTRIKDILANGDTGTVDVQVTYNNTLPTGSYTVTGSITSASGTTLTTLSGFTLQSNNSYTNRESFTVNNNYSSGVYRVSVTVSQTGGSQVNATTLFQVRDWRLAVEKATTASGFEYRYVAFANSTVRFEALPTYQSNGSVIENLSNNFTVFLNNSIGITAATTNVTYNSTCSCYIFNLTTPTGVGEYRLGVSAIYSNQTLTVERIITVTNLTASAIPTDANKARKEIFTTNEFVYIQPTAQNKTAAVNVTQVELSITFENGTSLNYTNTSNSSAMNLSDRTFQWFFNTTTELLTLDPPPFGGQYVVDLFINNRAAFAQGKFTVKPYRICSSAKGSSDTSVSSDYWWQFKTTDTIYLQIGITQFEGGTNTSADTNSSGSSYGYYGSGYGSGRACSISTTQQSVSNATLSVLKVINTQTGMEETLNTSASTCQSLSTAGTYLCTVKSNSSSWVGGSHAVVLRVAGPDGTLDIGYGTFEARAFYLYGWTSSWRNQPTSNISITVNMYNAGSGWWSSGQGMAGTVTLERVEYYGSPGDWLFPPLTYNYSTSGVNASTISNGLGNIVLPASLAPGGRWRTGSYNAVLRGTDESGNVDFGRVWFEIRQWEAYATPVEIQGTTYRYKYLFNTQENITLHVKISNAGDSWDSSGTSLGGNVTIGIKKIEFYATWPPRELNTSLYTFNRLNVSLTNAPSYNANASRDTNYMLTINRTSGRWQSGYYNIILDINGTETGYGWFTSQAFYVETRQVDAAGNSLYTSKGAGPLYFNTTTTKNQKWYGYYQNADYVNTTISDLTLHTWRSTDNGWTQTNYNYPEDINMSVNGSLRINGTGLLNITYLNGTWPSGWYYGELLIQNSDNETVNGNVYFSVRPFRPTFSTASYTIATTDNLTASVVINEPDWSNNSIVSGNFSVTSITSETWASGNRQLTNHTTFTLSGGSTFNGSATNITIQPPSGRWTAGYLYLNVNVKNLIDNTTETGYISFRATPFTVTVVTPVTTIGLAENFTVNLTLRNPTTGALAAGNLTQVYYWGWPSTTLYNFTAGSCSSSSGTGNCMINGSANVTVAAPAGGWEEGYRYMYFTFTPTDSVTPIQDWSSAYFNARPTITGYLNGWESTPSQNVTVYVNSLRYLNNSVATVAVSSAQYALSSASCYSDSCRTYTSASWEVYDGSTILSNNSIRDNGYLRLKTPSGGWAVGTYYVKVTITSGSTISILKNGQFRIRDTIPPNVTITSPTAGQNITASSHAFTALTTESARCYFKISNYDQLCSGNSTNATVSYCNNTLYNGSTFYSYSASGYDYAVTTGGTSHSYTHTFPGMTNQDYVSTVDCYDTDWNRGTNATVFRLNVTDSSPPQGSHFAVNSTTPNTWVKFSSYWTDNNNLSGYIFSSNASGSWSNTSWQAFTTSWANVTAYLNATSGQVQWIFFANDSGNQWNSSTQILTVTTNSAPSWNATSSNSTTANGTILFSAFWTDDSNLSSFLLYWNNTGPWSNTSIRLFNGTGWSNITATLNSTINLTVGWQIYANDSVNIWNATPLQVITTTDRAPQWAGASRNSSIVNTTILFSVTWSDDVQLSSYLLSWNNSGPWANDSPLAFGGSTTNITKTLNATPVIGNLTVGWRIYANDSRNQWNHTDINVFALTNNSFPRASNVSSNATTAGASVRLAALWDDDVGLSTYLLSWNSTGSWTNSSAVSFNTTSLTGWSNVTTTLNSTGNVSIGWRIFASDSNGQWNATSLAVIKTT